MNAPLLPLGLTKLAKASDVAGIDRRRVVRGAKAVAKCALPFRSPHDSIDVVGTCVVLDQARQEIPVVGIVDAQRAGVPPVQISLLQSLDVRQVAAEYILEPANDLHAALLCCR